MKLAVKRTRADALAIFNENLAVVAAAMINDDGDVRELLVHTRDAQERLGAKRLVLQAANKTAADEADADRQLAEHGVVILDAPYASIHEMLIAVHGEVWDRGSREISWQADHVVEDPKTRVGSWHVAFKCGPHHLFRFWTGGDSSGADVPAEHPALQMPAKSVGTVVSRTGGVLGADGILELQLPSFQAPCRHEGRELFLRVRESRACTSALKDQLVQLLLHALGVSHGCGEYAVTDLPQPSKEKSGGYRWN